MTVYIPGPLRSYTAGAGTVNGGGNTVAELLADLEQQFPGIRFRMIDEQDGIRQHIKIFINQELARDLAAPLLPGGEVHIICALSGG